MEEVIATQSAWLGYWLNWLMFAGVFLPVTLFIWKETRWAALGAVVAAVLSGVAVYFMFEKMGYVKLLGLPHIVFWTPLALYLFTLIKRQSTGRIPRMIMIVVLGTILISLAFDYTDAFRYIIGERTPLAGTL
jgi:hypothetical protein